MTSTERPVGRTGIDALTRAATVTALTGLVALTAGCGGGAYNNAAPSSSSPPSASSGSSTSGSTTSPSGTGTSSVSASASSGAGGTKTGGVGGGQGTTPTATVLPNGSPTAAGLPTVGYTYGDLLLAAWAKGDRKAAARYATPEAVLALFNHKPIAKLVNFECGDQNPVVCGWIGAGDAQVVLALDPKRLARGATQAVVAAKVDAG